MALTPDQAEALENLRRKRAEYDTWRNEWHERIKKMRAQQKAHHVQAMEDAAWAAEAANCSVAQIAQAYGTTNWKTADLMVRRAQARRDAWAEELVSLVQDEDSA